MRGFFNPIRTALLVLTVLTVVLLAVFWPPQASAQQGVQMVVPCRVIKTIED